MTLFAAPAGFAAHEASRWQHRLAVIATAALIAATQIAPAANAAKVQPVTALDALPADEDEASLWETSRDHEKRIVDRGERYESSQAEAYLDAMADRLLTRVAGKLDSLGVEVSFFIVRRPTLSAWVYPYGKIAVTTGLLAGMDNDSQLAAIIGHELAHFIERHSYRELIADRRQSAVGKGLGLLATALVAKQTGVVDTNLMKAGQIWTDLVTSGYSRELEHDADAQGLELMAAGNYAQPEAVAAFEALRGNDAYGVVDVAAIWSSHPKLDDRIENLKASVAKSTQAQVAVDANAYRAALANVFIVNAQLDMTEHLHERARGTLERTLAADPDNAWAHYFHGESLRKAAPDGPDFAPRIAAYQRAVAANDTLAVAYRELGMAQRQSGASGDARTAFARYLELDPDAPDAGIVRLYLSGLASSGARQ